MFRLSKTRIITFFFLFAVFNNSQALSKSTNFTYTEKNISSYLSGIISMNKNNTNEANNFFKKIKPPPDEHKNFKIQFLRTLVLLGKFEKSFTYAKNLEEENANFDEANIILGINYFINNDYNLSEKYFEKLNEDLENNFYLERYFSDFLIAFCQLPFSICLKRLLAYSIFFFERLVLLVATLTVECKRKIEMTLIFINFIIFILVSNYNIFIVNI